MAAVSSQNLVNLRHDWYQNDSIVFVTIYIRNLKEEDLSVAYLEQYLTVDITSASEESYALKFNLAQKILPEKCRYKVMKTKVEIMLMKAEPVQWYSLEGDGIHEFLKSIPKDGSPLQDPQVYPTSHPVHRDWGAIARTIKDWTEEIYTHQVTFQRVYGEGTDDEKQATNRVIIQPRN